MSRRAKSKSTPRRLMTMHQSADYIGQSYDYVQALVNKGGLPFVRLPSGLARDGSGRRKLIDLADLDKLIDDAKECR